MSQTKGATILEGNLLELQVKVSLFFIVGCLRCFYCTNKELVQLHNTYRAVKPNKPSGCWKRTHCQQQSQPVCYFLERHVKSKMQPRTLGILFCYNEAHNAYIPDEGQNTAWICYVERFIIFPGLPRQKCHKMSGLKQNLFSHCSESCKSKIKISLELATLRVNLFQVLIQASCACQEAKEAMAPLHFYHSNFNFCLTWHWALLVSVSLHDGPC